MNKKQSSKKDVERVPLLKTAVKLSREPNVDRQTKTIKTLKLEHSPGRTGGCIKEPFPPI